MGFFSSLWGGGSRYSSWSWGHKCEDEQEEEAVEEECEPKSHCGWGGRHYSYHKSFWCKDLFCKDDDGEDDDCCYDPCEDDGPINI